MHTRVRDPSNPCASPTLTLLARNPASPSTGQQYPASASPLDEFRRALEGTAGNTDRGENSTAGASGSASRKTITRGARGMAKAEGAGPRGSASDSGSGLSYPLRGRATVLIRLQLPRRVPLIA